MAFSVKLLGMPTDVKQAREPSTTHQGGSIWGNRTLCRCVSGLCDVWVSTERKTAGTRPTQMVKKKKCHKNSSLLKRLEV